VTVVAGGRATNARLDQVDWQKIRPSRVLLDTLPGLRRTTVDFLVQGTGTATVTVTAERGGTASETVEIQ
jgi:hypothetical protein